MASTAVVGLVLAACGVSTTTQAYDPSLIRQVGEGSNAVASVFPMLQAETRQSTNDFSDPQTSQDTVLLFQGRLDKLNPHDLIRLANANNASAKHLQDALTKLHGLAASVAADRVDPSTHQKLSAGAGKFITAWNGIARQLSAAQVHSMRQLFQSFSPVYGQFQSVLQAAYQSTNRGAAAAKFDKARRAFVFEHAAALARLQSSFKLWSRPRQRPKPSGTLSANTIDAKAIVAKVNQEYPSGALATQYGSSSTR